MDRCVFSKELSAYLDDQLSEKDKLAIEAHLKACKLCSDELTQLKLVSQKLKVWQAPELDEGFDYSVKNKIVARELERGAVKMRKFTVRDLVPATSIAVVVIVAFLGMNVYMHRGIQGDLRQGVDDIGEQRATSTATIYEPHYMESYQDILVRRTIPSAFMGGKLERMDGQVDRHYIQDAALASSLAVREGMTDYAQSPAYSEGSVIVIQPILPATGEGEKIIRNGMVSLEVESGQGTYAKISEICQEFKGYLASSNFYKDKENREAGTIVMRIPKDKFTEALDRVSALGKVKNIYTDSRDVSQEYANLKSQLDASMVVYNKMLEALQKRQTTIPEAVKLESELTPILKRIEGLKNQIEYLNNAISFTTITVNFYEAQVSVKALKDGGRVIRESLLNSAINTVRFLAGAIPVVILVVVLGIALLLLGLLFKYLDKRFFKRG